jgi:hypothetical protein
MNHARHTALIWCKNIQAEEQNPNKISAFMLPVNGIYFASADIAWPRAI